MRTETPLVAARLLPLRIPVFETGVTDLLVLDPLVILRCDVSYILVLDREHLEWHMGMRDGEEILCWASCGTDLAEAIRML